MYFKKRLAQILQQRRDGGLYRSRRIVHSAQGAEVVIDGQCLLNFSSNDYLGLANHPELIKAFCEAGEKYGVGSGAAHLICGHMSPHHALEEELADFTNRPRALLFSTGYMANLGVIAGLLERHDTILQDRLNHASLIDAAQLSRSPLKRYRHSDIKELDGWLEQQSSTALVATDGVFSMDGDLAPLPDLVESCRKYSAELMVDDAHGFGVLGKSGAGTLEHYGLTTEDVPVLMCTLGKAVGTFGAFVAGSEELIEALVQNARSYIYTTALPPAVASATSTSLRLMQKESWRREKVNHLAKIFREGANQLGLELMPSMTPIQPLLVGEAKDALDLASELQGKGILAQAIRPPTVPNGSARIRFTFSATHSEQHVERLLDALDEAGSAAIRMNH